MPLTGVVFLMAMLAIIGMPPFSLFQSEFLIVRAAIVGGHFLPASSSSCSEREYLRVRCCTSVA